MDIFSGWENYVERLRENWLAAVGPQYTVVLAGDTSWAVSYTHLDVYKRQVLCKGQRRGCAVHWGGRPVRVQR